MVQPFAGIGDRFPVTHNISYGDARQEIAITNAEVIDIATLAPITSRRKEVSLNAAGDRMNISPANAAPEFPTFDFVHFEFPQFTANQKIDSGKSQYSFPAN